MGDFLLTGLGPPSFPNEEILVTHPDNVTQQEIEEFPAFQQWKATLCNSLAQQYKDPKHAFAQDPYRVRSIEIQSVDWFGRRIGFIKLSALITADGRDDRGNIKRLPGICFLRGGSVAVLMILRPKDSRDERWVVMTEQPRIPAGSLTFLEIPAGMIDDETENLSGTAAKEIEEETGFKIPLGELIDMTGLALRNAKRTNLRPAMYPSPGGCDEFITLFLWEKDLDRQEIEDLRDAMTGERHQGEMITLRICAYEDVWREGARDAKTLAAWALYEGLNRAGVLQREVRRRKEVEAAKARK